APWLISDYCGMERNIRSPMYRVLGACGLLVCLTVPVFGGRPVWVMVASQAFQAMLLPVITVPIMILLNRKDIMGEKRISPWINAGLWATLVFAILTTYAAVLGLVDTFRNLFA
ncbi:MAG: divalent metal cation transporter, partial [Gemmatimonadota bacterium]|nr:divalent metal cation transporter [Gemmatimonadota bacterium]